MYHLGVAVAGVIGLMALWIGVQALVRSSRRLSHGSDVLACWMCDGHGSTLCEFHAAIEKKRTKEGANR